MFVVSVCSLKGGVGKTTLVLGLAAAAVRRGIATLVVDLDPQGDATYALGVETAPTDAGDVLEHPERRTLERAVVASPWATGDQVLHVMPGSPRTGRLDRPDADGEALHHLRWALAKTDYDLVLIDAPPSLSGLTRSALVASDRAVIVAEPGVFSVKAAQRLLVAIDDIRRSEAGGLQPLGIVVNRFKPQTREHEEQWNALTRSFGPLVLTPPLPDRVAVQRAQGARVPITRIQHAAPVVDGFERLLDKILRASTWRAGRGGYV